MSALASLPSESRGRILVSGMRHRMLRLKRATVNLVRQTLSKATMMLTGE
tara:strand:+ start:386 stop:535 length:150 start_codon:yes stop_codon:yes gene_type:complete